MHDGAALTWREVVEKHHSALVDELAVRLDSEIEKAVVAAVAAERTRAGEELERVRTETRQITHENTREITLRSTAESLNQILRRLREAPAPAPALQLLVEDSAQYAQRAVVLSLENNQADSVAIRGVDELSFTFNLEAASAFASAVESRDPVVALASGRELSPVLAAAFGDDPTQKAYLFPVVARQDVIAMLVVSGAVTPAPLELLCEAAGMKIEALAPETPALPVPPSASSKSSEFVRISAAEVPVSTAAERLAWDDLAPYDQRLHLQAQRVARVRVAEMRLNQAEELRKGVYSGSIYGALRPEIEKARTDFLQNFVSKSPTMVDYLHLEILRSLAHDDDRLLGHEYPGPLV